MKNNFSNFEAKMEILSNITPKEQEMPDILEISGTTIPARVILFNDDWHTFDEVISQLIKAIHCTPEQAEAYAWEVHTKGKSAVFEGELVECFRVAGVLEEIALHTQIEY